MKKEEELLRDLKEMVKDTKAGKMNWEVIVQTSEYNEAASKPTVEEEQAVWMVDECYTSFHCEFHGNEFLMITCEVLYSADDKIRTTNLIFLPPLGIRYFDVNTLLPYSVEADQMLTYEVHVLWELLLEMYKNQSANVSLTVQPMASLH